MAANLQRGGLARFGKRFIEGNRIGTVRDPAPVSAFRTRTASKFAAYEFEKNVEYDDDVRPSFVPDDVIQPHCDKYWAPHPQTGVFGPSGGDHSSSSLPMVPPAGSVLEQKAWFRQVEGVDRPHQV